MQSGRTHTLGVLLQNVAGEYFPRIAAGIEDEARRHGYHLLISRSLRAEEEIDEIEVLLEQRVDGLILVPRFFPEHRANYRRLVAEGIPLVFVDSYYPDVPCPAVVGADEEGMRAVTRHLLALGHRRIAYFDAGYPEILHLQDRRRGFLRAMKEHGLKVPDAYVHSAAKDASAAITEMLQRSSRPTALVTATDYQAVMALGVAETLGLRVPDDIAITGFSDCLENVNFYRVPLTSVRVDLDVMGQLAMQRFLREVEKVSGRHEVTHVPATVIVRASTKSRRARR